MAAPTPKLALVLATFALGPLAGTASAADTYTVAPDTTDAAATSCSPAGTDTFACQNLRSAVGTAEDDNGSTIQLSAGTYTLTLAHLSINAGTNSISITGPGAGQTTIKQQAADRVLNLNSGTMTITGVTITNGDLAAPNGTCGDPGSVSGGGILNTGTLTLDNVTVTGNKAVGGDGTIGSASTGGTGAEAAGGGICSTGVLTITDSTISHDRAQSGNGGEGESGNGGGIGGHAEGGGIESTGQLTVTGSTISTNEALGGNGGDADGTSGTGGDADGQSTGGGTDATDPTGAVEISSSAITGNMVVGGNGGSGSTAGSGDGGEAGEASGSGVYLFNGPSASASISATTISGGTATGGDGGSAHGATDFGGDGGDGDGALEIASRLVPSTVTVSVESSQIFGNKATGGNLGAGSSGADNGDDGEAEGGGIRAASNASVTIGASTITSNSVSSSSEAVGGGIDVGIGATIINSTVASNTADAPSAHALGGGIAVAGLLGGGSATLVSDTVAANSAVGGAGGNFYVRSTGHATVGDTIITGGIAPSATSNCDTTSTTDAGANLEATSPSQCGFTASSDIAGRDPSLGPLQTNIGPPPTMALGAGSPAIRAGGSCPDPDNPAFSLLTDERGEPRGKPCDIGAFEGQAPHSAAAPKLTGDTSPGDTLTCTPSFSGDAPITYAYTWQRGHSNIAGATSATYQVVTQDQGQQLSCTVTAANPYGNATASSTSKPPKPTVTKLKQSHSTWREGSSKAKLSAAGKHHRAEPPVGTTFKFKLNTPATVKLTFTTTATGRKVKGKCVKQTRSNRREHSCKLTETAGTLNFTTGHSGTDKITFDGRLSGHKKLKPGVYKLVITATNSTGHGSSKSLKFTIAG